MYRIVIIGSGRGSNAEAILQAKARDELGQTVIVSIVSDQPQARILDLGARYCLPAVALPAGPFKTKLSPEVEQDWIKAIAAMEPSLIVLAGYMRVIKPPFIEAFQGRIINLHPSLLPKYPGLHSIRRAFEAGEKETGCTVHWLTPEIDAGQIIEQSVVPITAEDTLESLEAKVHAAEHQLLPAVIRRFSQTRPVNPAYPQG